MDFTSILFFLILVGVLAICYAAYLKGKFNRLRRIHFAFAGLAVVLPTVDVAQTLVALERGTEGNPIFVYFLTMLSKEIGLVIFITIHLAFSAVGLYVGWDGKKDQAVESRTLAAFLGLLWGIVVTWNLILMVMYGVA